MIPEEEFELVGFLWTHNSIRSMVVSKNFSEARERIELLLKISYNDHSSYIDHSFNNIYDL